jgi:hypothetical protein
MMNKENMKSECTADAADKIRELRELEKKGHAGQPGWTIREWNRIGELNDWAKSRDLVGILLDEIDLLRMVRKAQSEMIKCISLQRGGPHPSEALRYKLTVDHTMPPDRIEFRNSRTGKLLGVITGIGTPKRADRQARFRVINDAGKILFSGSAYESAEAFCKKYDGAVGAIRIEKVWIASKEKAEGQTK